MRKFITILMLLVLVIGGGGVAYIIYQRSLAPSDSNAATQAEFLLRYKNNITLQNAKVGDTFTVEIYALNANNAGAGEIVLNFDPTILEGAAINDNFNILLALNKNINNNTGRLTVDIAHNENTTELPDDGTTLVSFDFKIKSIASDSSRILVDQSSTLGVPNQLSEFGYVGVLFTQPTISTASACSNLTNEPVATITWSDPTGKNDGGYIIEIDNDNDWSNGYWSKTLAAGSSSTAAPEGFIPTVGQSGNLTFTSGQNYSLRIYYGTATQYSNVSSFTAATCGNTEEPPTNTEDPTLELTTTCSSNIVTATATWNEAGKGSDGYYINVMTDPNESDGFWNKSINSGTLTTVIPDGFTPQSGKTSNLVLEQGKTYYVYVYYNNTAEGGPQKSFTAATCQQLSDNDSQNNGDDSETNNENNADTTIPGDVTTLPRTGIQYINSYIFLGLLLILAGFITFKFNTGSRLASNLLNKFIGLTENREMSSYERTVYKKFKRKDN